MNESHFISKPKLTHLNIEELVIGAGGQQEAVCRIGELTVVDLFFVFLLEDPEQHGSLHIPHLSVAQTQAVL